MTTTPPEPFREQPEAGSQPSVSSPAPTYSTPAYQPAPDYGTRPVPTNTRVSDTNTYALVSIILTFIVPIVGIILGHMGLSQIKRTGDAGRGLALTAVIYGYCVTLLGLIFIVSYVGLIIMMIGAVASQTSY